MTESFWRGRSVFVTGASGFMGGWLVKRLVDEGADVVALTRDRNPRSMLLHEGLIGRVTTVDGCLEDFPLLRRSLSEY